VSKTDVFQVTVFILLGAILGSAGQCIRVVVGLKKNSDKADKGTKIKDWLDSKQLLISILIGAVAGILGAISLLGEAIDKQLLITLMTIGYAGTDFIEGFMKKKLPQ
jgi:membrane associated rhomboid family serine protease